MNPPGHVNHSPESIITLNPEKEVSHHSSYPGVSDELHASVLLVVGSTTTQSTCLCRHLLFRLPFGEINHSWKDTGYDPMIHFQSGYLESKQFTEAKRTGGGSTQLSNVLAELMPDSFST